MKTTKNTFRRGLEFALDIIGDIVPMGIGMRSPSILLERAELFLSKKSQQLELFIAKKLQRQHAKEIFQEEIKKRSQFPSHPMKKQKTLEKRLSKEDVINRLAEIERDIYQRERSNTIKHER
ncbi:hypothetical protein GCM10011344_20560 [Dokdonia pacifica]|uniref:Uncharacterized protein n=1 Tax=Dokdonia pacifica TaxID=1627892 RepID=A0A238VMT8_9FLAO|nr:hypothetical protein [Dokdonia pacifica]GGG19745.1 hypothetical protein GCM10011344_20560 [Dokdonia pacifica]SNR35682.1 hypothetical protein SAMN06265376_10176 [Dokdonia pacifica]